MGYEPRFLGFYANVSDRPAASISLKMVPEDNKCSVS